MNTFWTVLISLFCATFCRVQATQTVSDPFGTEQVLPTYFQNIKIDGELTDSLLSIIPEHRIYAAIRLGQLRKSSTIEYLVMAYNKEAPWNYVDRGLSPKYYILLSMGQIGGAKAQAALTEIADNLISKSSANGSRRYNSDSLSIFTGLFDAFSEIYNADNLDFLLTVYNNISIDHILRKKAYKSFLVLTLKDLRFKTLQDSIYYLLDIDKAINITNPVADKKLGIPSDGVIKRNAIDELIPLYSQSNPVILDNYKKSLNPNDSYVSRISLFQEIISSIIDYNRKAQKK